MMLYSTDGKFENLTNCTITASIGDYTVVGGRGNRYYTNKTHIEFCNGQGYNYINTQSSVLIFGANSLVMKLEATNTSKSSIITYILKGYKK